MGDINSDAIYQVCDTLAVGSVGLNVRYSWVDPNVTMDPYCDKPWAL